MNRRLWLQANAFASCDCDGAAKRIAPVTDMTEWVTEFEFWNNPDAGHHIMASLLLDGQPCVNAKEHRR